MANRKTFGTVRYAEGLWRMRRHGPVIAHCTDSEDFPGRLVRSVRLVRRSVSTGRFIPTVWTYHASRHTYDSRYQTSLNAQYFAEPKYTRKNGTLLFLPQSFNFPPNKEYLLPIAIDTMAVRIERFTVWVICRVSYRVLIIITSHGENGCRPSGLWIREIIR